MILSFSTQINGKPTFFVEKIHKCFSDVLQLNVNPNVHYSKDYSIEKRYGSSPKLHTIRKDKNDRWNAGNMIDFYINARTKDMYCFAPRIPVVSTQDIFMTRRGSMLEITIAKVGSYIGDDDFYLNAFQQGQLAINDGFDEYDDFRNYFLNVIEEQGKKTGNYWFSGKIIHWTDLKY